jgi:hypothetical protein
MSKLVTANEAAVALDVLRQFGKQSFKPEVQDTLTDDDTIGQALSKLTGDPDMILRAAANAYEDWNNHQMAAIIRTLVQKGFNIHPSGQGMNVAEIYFKK